MPATRLISVALFALVMLLGTMPAYAQESLGNAEPTRELASDNIIWGELRTMDDETAATEFRIPVPPFARGDSSELRRGRPAPAFEGTRPSLLLPLYVTAGALQGMDAYTTYRGLGAGARETNPLIRNGNVGMTIALKAATTGASILMAEKMWKRHKGAAIATMIASNVLSGVVVAHNYRVIRTLDKR